MRFVLAILFLVAASSAASACSQCMCGSPLPAAYLWGPEPDRARFGFEERYASKSNALDEQPGNEEENEHRVSGYGLWRPVETMLVVARLPYAFREQIQTPLGGPQTIDHNSGFSDAEITSSWRVAQPWVGEGRRAAISVIGGVIAPTGSNTAKDENGVRLDEHLQTGSGAWRGSFGGLALMPIGPGTFELDAQERWNGTNGADYHYGNTFLANAGFTSRVYSNWQILGFVNARSALKDEDGAEFAPNTGGTMIYAAPALRYWGKGGWIADLTVQLPVVSNLYGIQEEHTTARLGISFAP
jgi:hypothetical protein